MLGIYLSGHPLLEYEEELARHVTFYLKDLNDGSHIKDNLHVLVGGIITDVKTKITRREQMMAFINIEDLTGSMEVIVFPMVFDKYKELLHSDSKIYLKGRINYKEDEFPKIIAEEITALQKEDKGILIYSISERDNIDFSGLNELLNLNPGDIPVVLYLRDKGKSLLLDKKVNISEENFRLFTERTSLRNCLYWDKV